jgi:hypothetical protein
VRTYLYVDGENFTIRAQKLAEVIAKDPEEATKLRMCAGPLYNMQSIDPHGWGIDVWAPEPARAAYDKRTSITKNGIVFVRDELYWDCVGLWIAMSGSVPGTINMPEYKQRLVFDRATYFGSASGTDGCIEQAQVLHQLGFVAHVFQRAKPDDFAKRAKEDGITVISRPKPLDLLLATQVLEDASADNFDRCVFVGGDEDYVPLLQAVRRRGKQVWLVAFDRYLSAKSPLRLLSDKWIPYDSVIALRPLPIANP